MMTNPSHDIYDTYPDHVICHSKSGKTYFINNKLQCTCIGYGYRETCRHVEHVITHTLLQPITTTVLLPPVPGEQLEIISQLTKGNINS